MKRLLALILVLLSSISLAYAAVNLNTASVDELDGIKGVGPSKAKAIVDYRTKNGPFKSVDDLKGVKGFGEKSVAKLRSELTVGDGAAKAADTGNGAQRVDQFGREDGLLHAGQGLAQFGERARAVLVGLIILAVVAALGLQQMQKNSRAAIDDLAEPDVLSLISLGEL